MLDRKKFAQAVLKAKKIDKDLRLSDYRGFGRKNRVWIIAEALFKTRKF